MILSILTPALPKRFGQIEKLCANLEKQIGSQPVEHLVFIDNKRRSVGYKRDALLRAARGKYVAFVDDDDGVAPDYVAEILKAAEANPDVITFDQVAKYNDLTSTIQFGLGNPNQGFVPDGITLRNAWHVCAWRRELAIMSSFPNSNFGEDWAFAAPLCAIPNLREVHIPRVLHYYVHSSATTEAPPPA